jgi:glycosyltransferase involved in cell wall biosynthesis
MACEVPVVASRVGGLPEVIRNGVNGYVCPPEALGEMAERAVALLTDVDLHAQIARTAAEIARTRYCSEAIVPLYEAQYEQVLATAAP